MNLVVTESIRKQFPDLRLAMLVARGIDNHGREAELDREKAMSAERMRVDWSYESLTERDEIQAWREAYRAFGVKYKTSRPTAEAFLRRLSRGEEFPTISKAVDSYLLTETFYLLPVGGYDLSTVSGDITLRVSDGGEEFTPIGARETEVTRKGEVVYGDSQRVLTRKWNFRDCDACKITEESRDIVLVTEAPVSSVPTERLVESIEHIATAIRKYCGGEVTTQLLDGGHELVIAD